MQWRWSEGLWQKRLLCSVTVAKRSFLVVIQLSVWRNYFEENNHIRTAVHGQPQMSLKCSRPVARFWDLKGQNTFFGGKIFVFFMFKNKYFWAQQNLGCNKIFGGHCPWNPPVATDLKCKLPNRISFDVFGRCFCKVETRLCETLRSCAMRLRGLAVTTLPGASRSFNPALAVGLG